LANRCYALTIEATLNNVYRANVLHFQSTGTNDNDTLAAGESLVTGWGASIMASWLATLPPTYGLFRLSARRVDLKPSAVAHKYYGAGLQVGTLASDCTATQTCPTIFLVPTMGAFSGGKIFWPAIPQGYMTNSRPLTTWQTPVDACIAAMITGFTSSSINWTLCVFSKKHNTISSVISHSYSPFVGFLLKRRAISGYKGPRHKKRLA
jgi:hypothetical protein